MTTIIVPSDITVVEEKNKIAKRRLTLLEKTGLLGMWPTYHMRYSKMDKYDMKAVLQRKYDSDKLSPDNDICFRRQESIRKAVVAHNFHWAGGWTFAGLSLWSLRKYDYKARALAVPCLFYVGMIAGRIFGDMITGRNNEFARDRFLGELPAKVALNDAE